MKRFLMTVVMLALAGCETTEIDGLEGIASTSAKYEAAFNAGDAAALTALYTPDAVVMAPNLERLEGQTAIRGLWQSFFDAGVGDFDLKTSEVVVAESRATEIGRFSLTAPDGRGGRVTATGKYVILWQRLGLGGGVWRLHRYIWNNDPVR